MSETPEKPAVPVAPTAAEKMKLTELRKKVVLIAMGADKTGKMPSEDGYDTESAPTLAMRWCASVLRILLSRMIEFVIETRQEIYRHRGTLFGTPAVGDKPATEGLVSQVGEMTALMEEIVKAIKNAQAMAGGAPPQDGQMVAEPPAEGAQTLTPEEMAAAGKDAELDAMAAKLAEASKHGQSATVPPQAIGKIVPIQQPKA